MGGTLCRAAPSCCCLAAHATVCCAQEQSAPLLPVVSQARCIHAFLASVLCMHACLPMRGLGTKGAVRRSGGENGRTCESMHSAVWLDWGACCMRLWCGTSGRWIAAVAAVAAAAAAAEVAWRRAGLVVGSGGKHALGRGLPGCSGCCSPFGLTCTCVRQLCTSQLACGNCMEPMGG